MKRKLISLVLAIMLVASCAGAFAVQNCYDATDLANMEADFAAGLYAGFEPKYSYDWSHVTINDNGITVIVYESTWQFNDGVVIPWPDQTNANSWQTNTASLKAFGGYVVNPVGAAIMLNAIDVEAVSVEDALAKYPGYEQVGGVINGNTIILFNGTTAIIVPISANVAEKDFTDPTVITTAQDTFEHIYTNYNHGGTTDIVTAFSFTPKAFGDGINFCHTSAKSLFSITVKYASTLYITLKDADGRMYPISNAKYSSGDNAYVATIAKNTATTFYWYGTDTLGWHAQGSATAPKTMQFDLKVKIVTTSVNSIDGSAITSSYSDDAEIRFNYKVSHSDKNHCVDGGKKTSVKTGDTRMAYIALAGLVVLCGAAVIVTKKVRNNI